MRLLHLLLHGLIGVQQPASQNNPEDALAAEQPVGDGNLIWRALGDNPVAAFIASISAIAFTSACLLNVGYTFAWDMAGILLFTPGDYVSLSIPIFIFVGALGLLVVVFGLPLMVLVLGAAVVSAIINWRDNLWLLAGIIGYALLLLVLAYLARSTRKRLEKKQESQSSDGANLETIYRKLSKLRFSAYAFSFYYLTLIGIAVAVYALPLSETFTVFGTSFLFSIATFSIIAVFWRVVVGLPTVGSLVMIVAVSFLVSMPFAGYSLFVQQWNQAKESSSVECAAADTDDNNEFAGTCLLRVLERGVLLADRESDRIIFEDSDGRRIFYPGPGELPSLWAVALFGGSEFGPFKWTVERAQRFQELREERRREDEAAANENQQNEN